MTMSLLTVLTCMPNHDDSQIDHLSLIGGANPGHCVRRVMRAVAANIVWSHFSLKGKNEKLPLIDTTLCKVIKHESEKINNIVKNEHFFSFLETFNWPHVIQNCISLLHRTRDALQNVKPFKSIKSLHFFVLKI